MTYILSIILLMSYSGSTISQVLLAVPVIFLIWVIKNVYIRNKKSKMGNQLIKLLKVPTSLFANLIITIILIVTILVAYYFNMKTGFFNKQILVSSGIFVAFNTINLISNDKFFGRFILEKGICVNGYLIEWDRIQSYKWVKRSKESNHSVLEITKKTNKLIKMHIFDDQKEQVNEVLKRLLSV